MSFDRTHFTFAAGALPAGRLRVLSFRGQEAVSEVPTFDVTIAVAEADVPDLEAILLGQPATLGLYAADIGARTFSGIVADVEARAAFEQGRHAFRVQLAPRLWLLGKRTTSRIFQNTTVPQIVDAVLDQAGVPHRWALVEKYPERVYCVQYQETDLTFVTRLLAEEGIFYFFEHAEGGETLVLCDSAQLYEPIAGDPELVYRYEHGSDGLVPKEHHVTWFARCRSIEPGAVLQRDYDFRRPMLDLRAEARSAPPPTRQAANDVAPFEAQQLRVYEHHGEDERPDIDGVSARVYLEQLRQRARIANGSTACRRLVPGFRFNLVEHEIDALNGSYAITRVEHVGRAPEIARGSEHVYKSTFACVPANVPMRPARPARRIQQVTETAIVVGPPEQEIHTDEHGRIKIQFPWDLDGKHNEHSSCWVRVAQQWAGAGWGFQFIPRIGMEVIVTFLGGDTDRPLITGCVPNAINVPPFTLPANRTKSGIKTRSTPGSRGYNELSFEDAAGKEHVRLHAARDLVESVSRDREATVGRSRITRITQADVEHIGGGKIVHVTGAWKEHARGHRSSSCDGDVAQTVCGQLVHKVGGTSSTTVDKSYVLHVAGNGDVVFGSEDKECHHSLFVHGDHLIGARDAIRFRADKAIVLQCGDNVLELSPEGLRIRAKRVDVVGTESTSLAGKGSALRLADEAQVVATTLRLFSEAASLVLDKDAKLKGKRVLLNCDEEKPTSATADDKPVETKPFKMKLSDADYGTYADKKFHLLVDGATYEGTTDADGMVVKAIPKEAKSVNIVLWISDYPTGAQKTWTISVEEMPDVSTVRGAQQRLSNLGYYRGEPGDKMDERTRDAVRDFQAHVGLPSTGELDAATVVKLNTLHGK